MTNTLLNPRYPDLENKRILVTGGSRGIGKSILYALAVQKAHCLIQYRKDKESVLLLEQELQNLGAKTSLLQFDMTDFTSMQKEVEQCLKEGGPISGLVNNAGINKDQLSLRVKPSDVEELLQVNLQAPIILTTLLSKNFLRAPEASIVNISSIVGLMGNSAQSVYSASKSGLTGFTKSIAKELGSKNVRCNAICPGFIETEMTEKLSEEVKQQYFEKIPLKRFGKSEEVAQLVCFLLSRASSYITGEILKIDGGLYS
jgi:3-oxoacyl-[acyl-carrier protein] reductase